MLLEDVVLSDVFEGCLGCHLIARMLVGTKHLAEVEFSGCAFDKLDVTSLGTFVEGDRDVPVLVERGAEGVDSCHNLVVEVKFRSDHICIRSGVVAVSQVAGETASKGACNNSSPEGLSSSNGCARCGNAVDNNG